MFITYEENAYYMFLIDVNVTEGSYPSSSSFVNHLIRLMMEINNMNILLNRLSFSVYQLTKVEFCVSQLGSCKN